MSRSRCAAIVFACLASTATMAADSRFEVAELMTMLAQVDQSTVEFEETRHLSMLSTPIVRRGFLHYVRPDRLEMRVVNPVVETTEISGTRIRVESSSGTREWDFAQQPVALAWIEAIRASLAGDAPALMRNFHVALTGSRSDWRLRLEPSDGRVAAVLSRIEVRGRLEQLTGIDIVETKGDRISVAIGAQKKSPP